jgi:protein-disulfide isomerase
MKILPAASIAISAASLALSGVAMAVVAAVTPYHGAPSLPPVVSRDIDPEALLAVLVQHPGILVAAAHAVQEQQEEAGRLASVASVSKNAAAIFPADAPFIGNPGGRKVVAEFFDYQCGFCRMAEPLLRKAVERDPELKIVFRDLPIEGASSVLAARAAAAAGLQGRYLAMHDALMRQPVPLDRDRIAAAAAAAGLDAERMRRDMDAEDGPVAAALKAVRDVSGLQELGIAATPTFAAAGAGILKGFGSEERFRQFTDQAGRPDRGGQ